MTDYFVRKSGNNGNDGLTPATAKLTIQAGSDLANTPGDRCVIGGGTYRETVTINNSGAADAPIELLGDYTGQLTGDPGVVRVTGSDNDVAFSRSFCITSNSKNYLKFKNLSLDLSQYGLIHIEGSQFNTVENCYFNHRFHVGINLRNGAVGHVVRNCYFSPAYYWNGSIGINNTSTISGSITIENNISFGWHPIYIDRVGGVLIRNNHFLNANRAIYIATALNPAHSITVNNNIFSGCNIGLAANAVTEIIEDYNTFAGVAIARVNTNAGANSNTIPPLFDARWFFEAVKDA